MFSLSRQALPLAAALAAAACSQRGAGDAQGKPWAAFYGAASAMGDFALAASTFHLLDVDADPGVGNFTPAQIAQLRSQGAVVISYMNVGACERFRTYWSSTGPGGPLSCGANTSAQLGPYAGYPDEVWMDLSNPDYQLLLLNYVAPRLLAQGVDGFFLDNMELVEHGPTDANGPCSGACRQGGLDLVRQLREKFPKAFIVMQNATGAVTRTGVTAGISFPTLLDGISHEQVYQPYDARAEAELIAWQQLGLKPKGRALWIATEDYVGSCSNVAAAKPIFDRSRANRFDPYATDRSAGQQLVCYWNF
jgi:cysteinyl-tRNA synthetase